MKRNALLAQLAKLGVAFLRHGGNHDIYIQAETKISVAVPRHVEIKESTARKIIKTFKG
jgi:predicted RNA binding protein YcfA (HicA-like mRNA interferase family)